jgi:mRNA interferase MazF
MGLAPYSGDRLVRAIHLAYVDKFRPVLVLTRESVRPYLNRITVAAIASTVRGIPIEVPVGAASGLDHDGVVSCDNIYTIAVADLGEQIGFLLPVQEPALAEAIAIAFDLE